MLFIIKLAIIQISVSNRRRESNLDRDSFYSLRVVTFYSLVGFQIFQKICLQPGVSKATFP